MARAREVPGLDCDEPFARAAARVIELRAAEVFELAAKRLRYVLEIVETCFGPSATAARRTARELQGVLGDLRDCDVTLPKVAGVEALEALLRLRRGRLFRRFGELWEGAAESGTWTALERSLSLDDDPLAAAIERSSMVGEALREARRAHAGQTRNSGDGATPFIDHPLAVAELLAEQGYPHDVLAAALLHDAIEKGGMELDELPERFGDTVAGLVDTLTEDAAISSYEDRKDEHRNRVARAGRQAQAIFAADKLVNVEALRDAYAARGEGVDRELQVPLDTKLRTWERDLKMLAAEEPGPPLVNRLADELAGLRRERAKSTASPR